MPCLTLPIYGMYLPLDEDLVPLRLLRTFIAALLALCLAAFPVAMPQAAGLNSHSHDAVGTAHSHDARAGGRAAQLTDCHEPPSAVAHHDHASPDEGDDGDNGASCCGTMTCHAFQISAAPALGHRLPLTDRVRAACDRQAAKAMPGGLDRPPRTI